MKLRHTRQGVYSAMVIVLATIAEAATPPSNPCTPQWVPNGWAIGPSIGMTAPPGPIKLCYSGVGGVHVTVEADTVPPTAGQVAYYDANNCPDPGSPPEVWIMPQTTIQWTVYLAPSGTTPPMGYGKLADFIVYHAKFFEIHWKIIGHIDATANNLAWDDEVSAPNHTRVYVRPEITIPCGNPPNDNHYTFSFTPGSAWPNGRCTIHPRGLGADPDPWWFTWAYPAITGCIKSQDLGVSPYDYPYLYYDRLPNSNGSFGNKSLTLTQNPAACSHSRTIQLFFPVGDGPGHDNAMNHPSSYTPGGPSGVTPNWFYYWYMTTAKYGSPRFDPSLVADDVYGYTQFVISESAWRAYLIPASNDPYEPPVGDNEGIEMNGIDTFAYACRHENRHVTCMTSWWPTGYNPSSPVDGDGDRLPDAYEPALGGSAGSPVNGGPFYPHLPDSNFDDVPDNEAYTFHTQSHWPIGGADGSDWSEGGHQWNQ